MPSDFKITRVNQTPAHELVAEQLQRAIMLGRYMPGDKLPPERTMADLFGVSRTSVREAIHILVGYGLLEIKRGASGGAIVQDMINKGVRERMKPFARARKKKYKELQDFRLVIECAAARLAAQNRRKKNIADLERHVARMDNLFDESLDKQSRQIATRFYAQDTAFHIAIARASGNQYIHENVEESRYKMFIPLGCVVAEFDEHENDKHHKILTAIIDQDGDLAESHMRSHIQGSFNSVFGN